MLAAQLIVLVAAVACGSAAQAAGARPPPLVLRCCLANETLAPPAEDGGGWSCRAVGLNESERPWVSRIYAPAQRGFLKAGQLPPHWTVREGARPACSDVRALAATRTVPYLVFAFNASLFLRQFHVTVPPERYCSDASAVLVCADDVKRAPPPSAPAKCCPARQLFDGQHCVAALPTEEDTVAALNVTMSALGAGWPECADGGQRYHIVGALAAGVFRTDGALVLGNAELPARQYCVEVVRTESSARVLACEREAQSARADAGVGASSRRNVLYGCALAVGAAFLAATLAGGLLLPAAHRALHWRCQTQYVSSLLLGDILLAITHLAETSIQTETSICYILAVCMHFLFLSAFFWLNTMCFNIWWTFRDFRPTSLERGQEACRLRVYCAYAWGGPLALAGAAVLVDHLAGPVALRPGFAKRRCWFYGDAEILVYFFGPVGVLLCVNLALFASTTRQLTCGLWRRDDLKSTSERAALGRVCAKLVVVMGVTWAADVISWVVGGPEYVWYVTDLFNALQGVFIFIVVGCQPQVWASVKRWSVVRACWRRDGAGASAAAPLHSSSQLPSCGESLTHTTAQHGSVSAPAAPATPAPAVLARPPVETAC